MMALAAWIACAELMRTHARSLWIGGAIAMHLSASPCSQRRSMRTWPPRLLAWVWLAMSCRTIIGVASPDGRMAPTGATGIATAILAGVAGYEMWEWTNIVAPPPCTLRGGSLTATVWTLMAAHGPALGQ
ncbi:MAG: hypothetical protein R3B46_05220 [Phycisphaerales bacterium]